MTKTARLREALISRGFEPTPHASDWECYKGQTRLGVPLWIWLGQTGCARYNTSPVKGTSIAMTQTTIGKIIAGQPVAMIANVRAEV